VKPLELHDLCSICMAERCADLAALVGGNQDVQGGHAVTSRSVDDRTADWYARQASYTQVLMPAGTIRQCAGHMSLDASTRVAQRRAAQGLRL
jgi:hypothetical protein